MDQNTTRHGEDELDLICAFPDNLGWQMGHCSLHCCGVSGHMYVFIRQQTGL